MIHDLKKRGVQDAVRINVCDQVEMKEWAAKFKVRPEVLKQAFDAVGSKINNLREYLHEKHFIVAS
jgi:hypothetical protein